MNPPILYKAKTLDVSGWVIGHYAQHLCDNKINHFLTTNLTNGLCTYLINFETLCIFIGLLDKNKKEISSGDKIKGSFFNDNCELVSVDGVVKYDNGCFKLDTVEFGYLTIAGLCNVEIIGNIFD